MFEDFSDMFELCNEDISNEVCLTVNNISAGNFLCQQP